jgi:hypothetical protein
MNKNEIREQIFKRLSKRKLNSTIIEGIISEHIENELFVLEHDLTNEDLPSKSEMKWWFQDAPPKNILNDDVLMEVQLDEICLTDKLATKIFKYYYKWKWDPNKELPKEIIELMKLSNDTKRKKDSQRRLLENLLIGIIRFKHLERRPYFYPAEIIELTDIVIKRLKIINKINDGFFEKEDIINIEPFYLFSVEGN